MRVLKNSLRTAIWYHVVRKGLFDWLTTVKLDDFRVLSATSKDLSSMLISKELFDDLKSALILKGLLSPMSIVFKEYFHQ